MSCLTGVTANIINDCDNPPIAGLEPTSWIMDRSVIETITYDSTNTDMVTALALSSTNQAYKIGGFKKSTNAGYDATVSDMLPDSYKHFVSYNAWAKDAATMEQIKNIKDAVIITENKDKGTAGNGAFEIWGLKTGLYKTSATRRTNDNNNINTIEMATQDGEDADAPVNTFFKTDYATTKAAVVALETPAA